MQEFSSVTASSYDADSLAPLLNEKAADGWSVVSIVAAGTNIVAYLQRETTDVSPVAEQAPADEAVTIETAADEAPAAVDEPAAETPFVPVAAAVAADAAADEAPAAVDEPAGWATAPEETADTAADASVADLAAQVSEPEPVAEPVVEAAPAAESAVPAGWYADPSGRFELRYWDGAAWTEHVSRAGQQFTDPPVA
jgi:uncharacterized protein YbdZ (MbtH family)